MDFSYTNTHVVVTGGASNIGRGIVHAFAEAGARITVLDRDEPQAAAVAEEALVLGAAASRVECGDLSDPDIAARCIDLAVAEWGPIEVLVNCAGWSYGEFFAKDTERARWQRTVESNLFTAIACTQAALPSMTEAGRGAIVFISSDAANGELRQGVYGATKAGVIALARTIAREEGRHGIRANVVSPGLVMPAEAADIGEQSLWAEGADTVFTEPQLQSILRNVPLGRLSTARDVANAVLWLGSERLARQLTGQVVSVSGGYAMP